MLGQLGAVAGTVAGAGEFPGGVEDAAVEGPKHLELVSARLGAGRHAILEGVVGVPELLAGAVRQGFGDLDQGGQPFGPAGQDGHPGGVRGVGAGGAEGADQPVGVPQVLSGGLQLVVDRGGGVGGVPQLLGELFRSALDGAQCRTARVGIEQDLGGVPAQVVDGVLVVPQRPLERCGLFHRGVQEISGVVEPPADGLQDASCLLAHRGPPPSGTLSWPSWSPRRLLS